MILSGSCDSYHQKMNWSLVFKKLTVFKPHDTIMQWRCHTEKIECHLVDKNKSKNCSPKLFHIFRWV